MGKPCSWLLSSSTPTAFPLLLQGEHNTLGALCLATFMHFSDSVWSHWKSPCSFSDDKLPGFVFYGQYSDTEAWTLVLFACWVTLGKLTSLFFFSSSVLGAVRSKSHPVGQVLVLRCFQPGLYFALGEGKWLPQHAQKLVELLQ